MNSGATDCTADRTSTLNARASQLMGEWELVSDGPAVRTQSSLVIPVVSSHGPAVLKVTDVDEEQVGLQVLRWWAGRGAVQVLHAYVDAVLMERLAEVPSLREMALDGGDDEATINLCAVLSRLHQTPDRPHDMRLPSLQTWFSSLLHPSIRLSSDLEEARQLAFQLLDAEGPETALHGDMHHDNAMWHPNSGWTAIDPKGLIGDRTFDFVNLLRNPPGEIPLRSDRFSRQVEVISRAGKLDIRRLLEWTVAFCSLSAIWYLEQGSSPDLDLAIAELARARLKLSR